MRTSYTKLACHLSWVSVITSRIFFVSTSSDNPCGGRFTFSTILHQCSRYAGGYKVSYITETNSLWMSYISLITPQLGFFPIIKFYVNTCWTWLSAQWWCWNPLGHGETSPWLPGWIMPGRLRVWAASPTVDLVCRTYILKIRCLNQAGYCLTNRVWWPHFCLICTNAAPGASTAERVIICRWAHSTSKEMWMCWVFWDETTTAHGWSFFLGLCAGSCNCSLNSWYETSWSYLQVDSAHQDAQRRKLEAFLLQEGKGDAFDMVKEKYLKVGPHVIQSCCR